MAAYALNTDGLLLIVDHGSNRPWAWKQEPEDSFPAPEDIHGALELDPARWRPERLPTTRPTDIPTARPPRRLSSPTPGTPSMPDLFDPVTIGTWTLKNRIAMAPMTRSRVGSDGVPQDITATYYRQRATAGLSSARASSPARSGRATSTPRACTHPGRSRAGAGSPTPSMRKEAL